MPLVLYVFSTEGQVQDLFVHGTRSGAMCINDTIMQYAGKQLYQKNLITLVMVRFNWLNLFIIQSNTSLSLTFFKNMKIIGINDKL